MRITPGTKHFCPLSTFAVILLQPDIQVRNRFIITRPARSRIKFRAGDKKVCPAAKALVNSRFFNIIKGTRERELGSFFGGNEVLLGSQYFLPIGIGFTDLFDLDYFITSDM